MRISKRATGIEPYTAGEQFSGYIKLNTNENPYPPAPGAAEALRDFSAERLRLYPSVTAAGLVEAIAEYEGVKTSNVFVGNGSDEVLALAFAALFDDKPVEFPTLTYSFYPVYCNLFSIPFKTVPLREDMTIDFKAYNGRGGAVIANPNAPTALACMPQEIAGLAERTDRAVLVDEAYIDFASVPSAVPLVAAHENLAVVKTFSKSYSLAGIRCGYMVASEKVIEAMTAVKDSFNSYPVDSVCEAVCAAAVRDTAYRDMTVRLVKSTRERICRELDRRGVFHTDSQTNFILMEGDEAQYLAFKAAGILVRYFNKPGLDKFLRVTVGTDADMDTFLKVYDTIRGADPA